MKKFFRQSSEQRASTAAEVFRAVSYFREDRRSLHLLVVRTTLSTGIGLLQGWPLAVMSIH